MRRPIHTVAPYDAFLAQFVFERSAAKMILPPAAVVELFFAVAVYTIWVLPTIPQQEFVKTWRLGLSHKHVAWTVILLVNVWLLAFPWLLSYWR